jgi:hypothetical protein
VSAATKTTEKDTIGRRAETGSGDPPRTRGWDLRLDSAESYGLEPISREQISNALERSRLAFLYQEAIASHARARGIREPVGSEADLLGTDAAYRRFPV